MLDGNHFPNLLSEFVYTRTYARWLEDAKRRETWPETVRRYVSYILKDKPVPHGLGEKIEKLILDFDVLGSMRALWCAGPAMDRDNVCGYNCSFLPVDNLRAFSEALYVLMCFHPDTLVKTKAGDKRISEVTPDDEVATVALETGEVLYVKPERVLCNPTTTSPKLRLTFEDGHEVVCTEDHLFHTKNRGWVKAVDLTEEDDL
jgi:hypothetical protein